MSLVDIELPSPGLLKNGWAALAAVYASRGWLRDVYATADQWMFHDGGGNWACLRYVDKDQFLLLGHDHEYSETYYGEAATYFEEKETDLLAGAPDWWKTRLDLPPCGEWIGFVYGWNGRKWQRASYDLPDGFDQVGLLRACSMDGTVWLAEFVGEAPGLNGSPPDLETIEQLLSAGAATTPALLERAVPGWDGQAGAAAANRFQEMPL